MPESFVVFISYKREDQAFAETLRERLIAWGYTVWMDKYNIPAGAYWPDEIDQGLNVSKVVIGVLSPDAIASRNVKNEWDWAIVNGKRLLLLMVEPCIVPMNYVSINYIDCVRAQATGLARLQEELTDPTSQPSPTDPYHDYLQALYDRINTYLAHTIIKVQQNDPRTPEPLPLRSERTRGAVDALFEKHDEIDPLFMFGGIRQESVRLDGDFRVAFEYFDGRVLLLGEPGAGKTITLLHFGRDAVVQRIQDQAKPLPVLVIIPTWNAEKQTPLAEWLAKAYGAPLDVARIVAEGRALLLLDGLDELGGERENPQAKERYDPRQRFLQIIPENNQIVVTCRVKDYEEIGDKIALKGAVTLKPLTDDQMRNYLSEMPNLWAVLESDEALVRLARNPYMLSALLFVYEQGGDLPRNTGMLFRELARKLWKRETERGRTGGIPFEQAEMALARLAYNMTDKDEARVPLKEALRKVRSKKVLTIANNANLVLYQNEDISFYHQLMQEYFAAVWLNRIGITPRDSRVFIYKEVWRVAKWIPLHLLQTPLAILTNLPSIFRWIGVPFPPIPIWGFQILKDIRAIKIWLFEITPEIALICFDLNYCNPSNNRWHQTIIALCGIQQSDTDLTVLIEQIASSNGRLAFRCIASGISLSPSNHQHFVDFLLDNVPIEQVAASVIELGEDIFQGTNAVQRLLLAVNIYPYDTIRALGVLKAFSVVPKFLEILDADLEDPRSHENRLKAIIESFGNIRDDRAVPYLLRVLKSSECELLHTEAARALIKIGGTETVVGLLEILNEPEAHEFFNRHMDVAEALGKLDNPEGIAYLREGLFQLHTIGSAAARALARIGTPGAVEALSHALIRRGPYLSSYVESIEQIGTPPALKILSDFYDTLCLEMKDYSEKIRFKAVAAAYDIGEPLKSTPVVSCLIHTLRDQDIFVRSLATWAFKNIKDPLAIDALAECLSDNEFYHYPFGDKSDIRICSIAAEALENIGTPESLAVVETWRREQNNG